MTRLAQATTLLLACESTNNAAVTNTPDLLHVWFYNFCIPCYLTIGHDDNLQAAHPQMKDQ
jgi:hypothetical protein